LASGATARVRLADLTDKNGTRLVACKDYNESFIGTSKQQIMREIHICRTINSPRFPRFEKVYIPNEREIAILMEPCDFSLHHFLNKNRHQISAAEQLRFISEIAEGLEILHQYDILHRDVKPANILLKWEHDRYYVKLTDFGAARSMAAGAIPTIGPVGTAGFMAPELFGANRYQLKPAVDIFGFAMTIMEILGYSFSQDQAADIPDDIRSHSDMTNAHLLMKWRELITRPNPTSPSKWRPEIPGDELSLALASLIQECWDVDPQRRPSARMINIFCESLLTNARFITPASSSNSP
jgi:serine/threonine protein kinase